jgi:hypothetical protein
MCTDGEIHTTIGIKISDRRGFIKISKSTKRFPCYGNIRPGGSGRIRAIVIEDIGTTGTSIVAIRYQKISRAVSIEIPSKQYETKSRTRIITRNHHIRTTCAG